MRSSLDAASEPNSGTSGLVLPGNNANRDQPYFVVHSSLSRLDEKAMDITLRTGVPTWFSLRSTLTIFMRKLKLAMWRGVIRSSFLAPARNTGQQSVDCQVACANSDSTVCVKLRKWSDKKYRARDMERNRTIASGGNKQDSGSG